MPRTAVGSAERKAMSAANRQMNIDRDRSEKNAALSKLFRSHQYGEALTMEQAAEKLGMNFRTYAKYLKDPDLLPLGVLRKIQREFGVPEEDLLPLLLLKR